MTPQAIRDAALVAYNAAEARHKARTKPSTGWDRVALASARARYAMAERALAKSREGLDTVNAARVK